MVLYHFSCMMSLMVGIDCATLGLGSMLNCCCFKIATKAVFSFLTIWYYKQHILHIQEAERNNNGRAAHSAWRNYDDFNEYFWFVYSKSCSYHLLCYYNHQYCYCFVPSSLGFVGHDRALSWGGQWRSHHHFWGSQKNGKGLVWYFSKFAISKVCIWSL